MSTGKIFVVLSVICCLIVGGIACAEEEVGLIPRIWRKFFGKNTPVSAPVQTEQAKPVTPAAKVVTGSENFDEEGAAVTEEASDDITAEEIENIKTLGHDLKSQKEERELIESIRRAKDAQVKPPQPPQR